MIGVEPVVDKDEFPACFGFVSEAVFRPGPRRLKRNLLNTGAILTVARTKVSVELEAADLLLQLRDLLVGLSQKVVCRFRCYCALKVCPDFTGVRQRGLFAHFLGQFCRRYSAFFWCRRDLLLQGSDPLLERASGLDVLLFQLLQLLL